MTSPVCVLMDPWIILLFSVLVAKAIVKNRKGKCHLKKPAFPPPPKPKQPPKTTLQEQEAVLE